MSNDERNESMSNERDELAEIIDGAFNVDVAVNGILAAGYRKPRTITGLDEPEA